MSAASASIGTTDGTRPFFVASRFYREKQRPRISPRALFSFSGLASFSQPCFAPQGLASGRPSSRAISASSEFERIDGRGGRRLLRRRRRRGLDGDDLGRQLGSGRRRRLGGRRRGRRSRLGGRGGRLGGAREEGRRRGTRRPGRRGEGRALRREARRSGARGRLGRSGGLGRRRTEEIGRQRRETRRRRGRLRRHERVVFGGERDRRADRRQGGRCGRLRRGRRSERPAGAGGGLLLARALLAGLDTVDRGFDQQIIGPADEQKMLDIIAPHDDQLAVAVDIESIDDVQATRAIARPRSLYAPSEQEPVDIDEQQRREQERDYCCEYRQELRLCDAGRHESIFLSS